LTLLTCSYLYGNTDPLADVGSKAAPLPDFNLFHSAVSARIDLEGFSLRRLIDWIREDASGRSFKAIHDDPHATDAMKLIAVPVSQPLEVEAITLCTDEFSRLDDPGLKWDFKLDCQPSYYVRSRIHDAIDDNFRCLGATLADPTASQKPEDESASQKRVCHVHLRLLTSDEAREVVKAVYKSERKDPHRPEAYRDLAHLIASYAAGHPRLCVTIAGICAADEDVMLQQDASIQYSDYRALVHGILKAVQLDRIVPSLTEPVLLAALQGQECSPTTQITELDTFASLCGKGIYVNTIDDSVADHVPTIPPLVLEAWASQARKKATAPSLRLLARVLHYYFGYQCSPEGFERMVRGYVEVSLMLVNKPVPILEFFRGSPRHSKHFNMALVIKPRCSDPVNPTMIPVNVFPNGDLFLPSTEWDNLAPQGQLTFLVPNGLTNPGFDMVLVDRRGDAAVLLFFEMKYALASDAQTDPKLDFEKHIKAKYDLTFHGPFCEFSRLLHMSIVSISFAVQSINPS
jgi:hypothetical protein